jgi:hypothetical protein
MAPAQEAELLNGACGDMTRRRRIQAAIALCDNDLRRAKRV